MNKVENFFVEQLVNYIDKDNVNNTKNVLRTINTLGLFRLQRKKADLIFKQLNNPENQWHDFIRNMKTVINENARKKLIGNLFLRGMLFPKKQREKLRQKQQIPSIILLDPTSACNLECRGCWAKDYSKTDSLSFDLLDRIIREGKRIKVFIYIFSGGEPLIRKKDIIKLCEMHPDCYFLAFTNGTLIDEQFCADVARVGNFAPAISIEGFEEMTDYRRGKGTYVKVIKAMNLMHQYGNLFGFSATYHRLNAEVIGSDSFLDSMLDQGCCFGWYFTYMPVGSDADPGLIIKPEQRAAMYHRLRAYRQKKPMFIMDFWNDGEYTLGCIAGGRQYMHINARGDVEPCAFIHYSNVNIKNVSVMEALRQPLFEQYRKNQPFNSNHLRPCPCLDNPEKLRLMVKESKAYSTHLNDFESVEQLTSKCMEHAEGWAKIASRLSKHITANIDVASCETSSVQENSKVRAATIRSEICNPV
jgi:MoaA/NifB/PqqE/SkfB family radical SAM enzyme